MNTYFKKPYSILTMGVAVVAAALITVACAGGGDVRNFENTILPLFSTDGAFNAEGKACSSCHYGVTHDSAHEMSLVTFDGIMLGADTVTGMGMNIVGNGMGWDFSILKSRLRNTRMPPGWAWDMDEANRDTAEIQAIGLLVMGNVTVADYAAQADTALGEIGNTGLLAMAAPTIAQCPPAVGQTLCWTAPAATTIGGLLTTGATFFAGSVACTACHMGNDETSAHELDLKTRAGLYSGADVLSSPPGVDILGRNEACAGYDTDPADPNDTHTTNLDKDAEFTNLGCGFVNWGGSKLRSRLRNTRMPPGWEAVNTGATYDEGAANRDSDAILDIRDWIEAGTPDVGTF